MGNKSKKPTPSPGCPGPPEGYHESEISQLFFQPANLPPDRSGDWKVVHLPGLKSGGLTGKPTITMDFGNGKDHPTEFIWRKAPGQGPEVLIREPALADKLLEAVAQMKERRKKIDQIDRAIRLINTADQAAKAVTRAAMIIQGKPFEPHPMEDDYKRAHEAIIETLISQKSYLEMQNNDQNIGTVNAAPVEKEVTYLDQLSMFIHTLLWRVDELEEARRSQVITIERLKDQANRNDDMEKRRIMRLNEENQSLKERNGQVASYVDKVETENAELRKTIGGLRSSITRLGGRNHPKRNRKK